MGAMDKRATGGRAAMLFLFMLGPTQLIDIKIKSFDCDLFFVDVMKCQNFVEYDTINLIFEINLTKRCWVSPTFIRAVLVKNTIPETIGVAAYLFSVAIWCAPRFAALR